MPCPTPSPADTHTHMQAHEQTWLVGRMEGLQGLNRDTWPGWPPLRTIFPSGALVSPQLPPSHPRVVLPSSGPWEDVQLHPQAPRTHFLGNGSGSGECYQYPPPTPKSLILCRQSLGSKALPTHLSGLPSPCLPPLLSISLSTVPQALPFLPRPLPSTWVPGHWAFQQPTCEMKLFHGPCLLLPQY